jgi:hypothetical protein
MRVTGLRSQEIFLLLFSLALPMSQIVILVSQDMSNVDLASLIMNDRDDPVLVSADVENGKLANLVCGRERLTQVREPLEISLPANRVPCS